ncbi:MAG: hypothetical protein IRY94_04710 [Rhodospirillaceae bacterium]|nr:hypothetical protein [Rhodospirillaceae bacterium]
MAVSIRIDRTRGREAAALEEFARQTVKYRTGGLAVHVRLGFYKESVPTENFLFAINMFRQMVDQEQGRLFVLDNSDVVIVYKGTRPHQVVSAVEKVRLLYSDVLHDETHGGVEFCTWYNLKTEAEAFLTFAQSLLQEARGKDSAAAAATAASGSLAPADVVATEDPAAAEAQRRDLSSPSLELTRLAGAVERLPQLNLAGVLRRQPVCLLRSDSAPEPVFQELYISIPEIERALTPGERLAADRWLFQYFTRLLDLKLLSFLTAGEETEVSSYFSLNLNVASTLSLEFTAFSKACSAARRTIVIELQKLDVFSDLGTFFYVRDMLREQGYRICLDGLTDLSLPFCDRGKLGVDMVKIRWRADILKDTYADHARDFAELIRRSEPTSVILCRADSDSAIQFGRSLGISMFQGHQVDRLLALRAVA